LLGPEAALGRFVVLDVLNELASGQGGKSTNADVELVVHNSSQSVRQTRLFKFVKSVQHFLLDILPLLTSPPVRRMPLVRDEFMRQHMESARNKA
jgi:hypothetical protein